MTEKPRASEPGGPRSGLPDPESIVDTVREPLVVLDGNLRVLRANRSFYKAFGTEPDKFSERNLHGLSVFEPDDYVRVDEKFEIVHRSTKQDIPRKDSDRTEVVQCRTCPQARRRSVAA